MLNAFCFTSRNTVSLTEKKKYEKYVLFYYGNTFPTRRKKPKGKQLRDWCVKIITTNTSIDRAN